MKSLVKLILFFPTSGVAFAQSLNEIEEMRNATPDRGHWLGLRVGAQTNGGNLEDRWLVGALYEWKYSNIFSLPVELQLFRDRGYAYNELGQYRKVLETRPILSVGLKARQKLHRLSPYVQIGLEYLSGSGFFLTTPNYAAGVEVMLSDKIVFSINIYKSIVPDYFHFMSLDFNVNVVPFVH